jgi:hypothetical protein
MALSGVWVDDGGGVMAVAVAVAVIDGQVAECV